MHACPRENGNAFSSQGFGQALGGFPHVNGPCPAAHFTSDPNMEIAGRVRRHVDGPYAYRRRGFHDDAADEAGDLGRQLQWGG